LSSVSTLAPAGAKRPADPSAADRLPFTVIDESVHLLDTPAEPWTIQVELALGGRLDHERLLGAFAAALTRHPMARARLLPARRTDRSWTWEIVPEPDLVPLRAVDCTDDTALAAVRDDLYSRQVPLVEAPPLRVVLARGPEGDRLLLSANHAALDGFGCVRLLHSLAAAYVGREDPPPPVDLADARDVERLLEPGDASVRRQRFRMLASKVGDVALRTSRLAPVGGSDRPGYGFHHRVLSPDTTERLDSDESGASVNDLLLAGLHVALAEWNEQQGGRAGRIGVLVPVNLRPKEWQKDVVTNFVLPARVLTTPDQRSSLDSVLAAVVEQTKSVKGGAGATLMEVIGRTSFLPLWLKQPLSPLLWATGNRIVDTALLSNLGQIDSPPDFGPDVGPAEAVFFSAPGRLPCGLTIGVATVDGRLHMSFRYRHPVLGAEAAAQFADRYTATLDRFIDR
jgi:NRPS condensation-like uncharacterized protein